MDKIVNEVEEKIDKWMIENLDKSIPRNRYIYHCNLAFIDIVVDQKALFTPFERHYLFSLTYNTYIAHLTLKEEEKFDYSIDKHLYALAFNMIIKGFQYSMLCDIFPMLHSEKGVMEVNGKEITFKLKDIPKRNFKYISDYSIRKALSYTLQMVNSKFQNCDDEEIAIKLAEEYIYFWNENMRFDDYEPYSRLEWGGIGFFFVLASMRRFNKLYKNDFNILTMSPAKMMIVLSTKGVKDLRRWVPTDNDKFYELALKDNIYRPIGNGSFPKLSISEAPLNITKDGFIFANPLVILFNDSEESRFLNYLRKCDNERYLRVKDKIKERVIPIIIEMIKCKFPKVISIPNFHVKIPFQNKNKRECDLLLVNEEGSAVYLEIKHFYNPQSFCETKKVDNELNKALKKMPDQLSAITESWNDIKKSYNIGVDLKKIQGIIVSHQYLGYDVEIDIKTPIVDVANLYESIAEANNLEEVFSKCKEIDEIYSKIKFNNKDLKFKFSEYNFTIEAEYLEPLGEIAFIKSYREQVYKNVIQGKKKDFNNPSDLAKAYLESLNNK